jgi:cytochrome c-type biogenesis protein CcmH
MSGFIVIAGLLTLATLTALLYPLLRKREGSPEAWRSAGIIGLLVLLGGAALYPLWSTYKWHEEEPALDSPQAMVGRLARRLEREPDDLDGWLMLGRSYSVIQQYDLAARAYQRADTLAGGRNADALMGLAEALLESGRSDLAGRAGRLFEQALEVDPNSVKALFYSAFAARERNELPLARERFGKLLAANPPEAVARIIAEQIQEIDALSRLTAQADGDGAGARATAAQDATGGAAAPVSVPLRITLSPAVADKAAAGAPLFVVARLPGQRGPPLAAQRLDARFPQDVELRSTDAMLAGSGFTAGQELEIEARIANGGGAISRSGDPFGVIVVRAGGSERAAIEINQLKP